MQRAWKRFLLFLFNNSIIGVLVVLCLVMGFLSDKFFTLRNWKNILDNFSVPGVVSLGVSVVVIAGGIDLSFGSILACCAILATWLQPHALVIPVVCTILLGGFLGWINGMIVTRLDTNPLITTLGTQWLFFAVLLILTKGNLVQGNTENLFHFIGHGKILGFPFPIYLFAATCLLAWFMLRKTQLGKYIYAYGSKKEALYSAGVNAKNVYLAAFVCMGLIVGIGGLLFSSRMIGVRPTDGDQYLLRVLTGVILSGVSLNGGIGSVVNVLIAVIVLGVIDNSMVLLGIQYKNQEMIRGCVFIVSIIYNNFMMKQSDLFARKSYSQAEREA